MIGYAQKTDSFYDVMHTIQYCLHEKAHSTALYKDMHFVLNEETPTLHFQEKNAQAQPP
jgi:hypothetical protein